MTTRERTADELVERIFEACLATLDVQTIHLGRRLGYYEALAGKSLTSGELAEATQTQERYTREWLEQQTVTGILDVADPAAAPTERRFSLAPEYAEVLNDRDSLNYLGPAASMVAAAGMQIDALVEAYRNGGGVGWHVFGEDMRLGQGEMNRPLFLYVLAQEWLASIADVDEALRRPGARIADVGCGYGWSAIGIAETYPNAIVTGYDIDEPSIDAARKNAAARGLGDRVDFHLANPAREAIEQVYDVSIALECVHDMADPVAVLDAMRRMTKSEGSVLIVDERTADEFDPEAGDMERFLYGFSVTTCLPDGLSHQPSVGTGTVMRTSTLARYARDAGFAGVDVLPIEHDQFRVYRLTT